MINITSIFIGVLSGLIAGWILNLLYINFTKANLVIESLEDKLNTGSDVHKFLHVKVINKERGALLRLLFGNKGAIFCKAKISFEDVNGFELLPNKLFGRWADTGEPVTASQDGARYFQYQLVSGLKFNHILPGESSNLAVAIKWEGEKEFYGFDNESYAFLANGFRDDDKKIKNSCILKVQLTTTDGRYREKTFKINSPSTHINNYKLTELKK